MTSRPRPLGGMRALLAAALLAAALAAQAPTPARAGTTIVVTATNPVPEPFCSLNDAIVAANTDQPRGGCPAGNGADTVVLAASSYAVMGTDVGQTITTGLVITSTVTIAGNGATISPWTGPVPLGGMRVIAVEAGGELTLTDATVSGGTFSFPLPGGGVKPRDVSAECRWTQLGANLLNCGRLALRNVRVLGGFAPAGAGIYNGGTLTAADCLVANNTAITGDGGGVLNEGAALLQRCTIRDNDTSTGGTVGASANGGGVASSGPLTLIASTLSTNDAGGDGGGIYSTAPLTVTTTTLSDNAAAGDGGAIYAAAALALADATVAGNTADANANGLGDGGGLFVASGTATVLRSIIAGNTDTPANAGPGNRYPDVAADTRTSLEVATTWDASTLPHDPLTTVELCVAGPSYAAPNCQTFGPSGENAAIAWRNLLPGQYTVSQPAGQAFIGQGLPVAVAVSAGGAPSVAVTITRAAGRGAPFAAPQAAPAPAAAPPAVVVSAGHNLIGDASGSAAFADGVGGDRVGGAATRLDPVLGPLADNGGPTQTRAALRGSPALDGGGPICPALDQRGVTRPRGAACDIGAFEQEVNVFVFLGVVRRDE